MVIMMTNFLEKHSPPTSIKLGPSFATRQKPRPGFKTDQARELVLIRGLPGSGKSTMARVLAQVGYKHFEADMFFMVDGAYRYDPSRIRDAHAWCQRMTRDALAGGRRVVVANTFTRLVELEPYLRMTDNCTVIQATGRYTNVHGVSAEALARMAARWESIPELDKTNPSWRAK